MSDKKEKIRGTVAGPVRGLLGVLVLVVAFLLLLAGVTFLIHVIME